MSFALTKTQPPRMRADLVPRTALAARLSQALASARLVLLSAPAGFGKTTLLTQQLSALQAGWAVAWVSIDEEDDVARLMACLVNALEPYDLPWRTSPQAMLAMQDGTRERRQGLVSELLNALTAADVAHGLIVIDDAHRIADPAVFEALDTLIERLPARWCVVMASRFDPPLALPRLRARGELAEFRQQDLRFSLPEVQAMVPGADAASRAQQLVEHTQGWAAGLRLSLNAGGHTPAHAQPGTALSQRHLFDYLASEVLADMPAELRLFLLRCSVLPELTAVRCSAVSGDARAAHWLDEIERRGLFVNILGGTEFTLRLHDLFRDFLEDRLRRDHADEVTPLLLRAAAAETDPVRRIGLLLRAGDNDAAQLALLKAAPAMLVEGALAQVLRLIEHFPPGVQHDSPVLAFVRGLCAWPRWDWNTMQRHMTQARVGAQRAGLTQLAWQAMVFETMPLITTARLDEAAVLLARLRAQPLDRDTEAFVELTACWYTALRGPADGPARHLRRMTELLSSGAPPQAWYRCLPSVLFSGRPGVGDAMHAYLRGAAAVAGETDALLLAVINYSQCWLQMWHGDFEAAEQRLQIAESDERWLAQPRHLRISILTMRLVLSLVRAERDAFRKQLGELLSEVEHDPERRPSWLGTYIINIGQFAAALEDWDSLQALRTKLSAHPAEHDWPLVRHGRGTLAALSALHEGQPELVCSLLDPLADTIGEHNMMLSESTLRATLARARLQLGQPDAAWAVLAPLIERTRSSRMPLHLLGVGRATLRELAAGPWPSSAPLPDVTLLQELADQAEELAGSGDPAITPTLGSSRAPHGTQSLLSERERDVLQRIAAGDSNKLIARAFDLSPHTVKRHVANILNKLDLASRGQAAAWWREHG